jgi:hypothetical protein
MAQAVRGLRGAGSGRASKLAPDQRILEEVLGIVLRSAVLANEVRHLGQVGVKCHEGRVVASVADGLQDLGVAHGTLRFIPLDVGARKR